MINKVFKRCMEEILGRLRSYGTLQPDSLEAMRNEYVVALLHASIHIVMDISDKELSMRPQYGIVGEGSKGRVDYAIKEAEDLICITEDKQHKVSIGFAQNIKQLESAYETNKKKRTESGLMMMISTTSMVLSQRVRTGTSFYIAPENYPR